MRAPIPLLRTTDPLTTDRLILRRWRDADRLPFAALNADAEVMRYFRAPLDRAASDAFVDRIEQAFDEHGYGLWAVEIRATGTFIGFTGLALQTFEAPFTPAVEVGWRLARAAWGHGYATEAARAALAYGFGLTDDGLRSLDDQLPRLCDAHPPAALEEIVSITTQTNLRSRAVMQRLGMTTRPDDDFAYPVLPEDHPLRPHVLYRLSRQRWAATR